jgi:type II secretion system protein L
MSARSFILFPGAGSWRMAVAGEGGVTFQEVGDSAALVAQALKDAGYRGQGVMLAIPSAWCLCAPILTAGLPAKSRKALAYRFEEMLPLPAEEVVSDYVPSEPGDDTALAVGVQKERLAPLVEALEGAGVIVSHICPALLLAGQQVLGGGSAGDFAALLYPAQSAGEIELLMLRRGLPVGWHLLPDAPRDVVLHLQFELKETPAKLAAVDLAPALREALAGLNVVEIDAPDLATAAALGSVPVLSGKARPWVDLRRDALAARDGLRQVRRPLTVAVAALVLCCLSLSIAMIWRASRYDAMTDRYAREQQGVFRQVFPTGAVPVDVRSRLESEERSLRALSGDSAAPPPTETGLLTLRDILTRLPAEAGLRYRVLELRLDRQRFTLDGQVTRHGDADRIAGALRREKSLVVDPPRTEQLPEEGGAKGVSFTITGEAVPSPALAKRGAP